MTLISKCHYTINWLGM